MMIKNDMLLELACMKFQEYKYDEALEAFVLAYSRGYEQEWIIEQIYNCYMAGNDETFRETYGQREIAYEDCILDFIPYKEGEYYIFDKEGGVFRGVFSASSFSNSTDSPALQEFEFSPVAVALNWNWNDGKAFLSAAHERNVYVICRDMKRGSSFFKLPELQEYAGNIILFPDYLRMQEYFHEKTAVYLPHVYWGTEEDQLKMNALVQEEHTYRLTPEGRNTDNILLTIGIPTHDRGHLLLKRLENLQKMNYDAEIEIAVSKNGTSLYQEEYATAAQIEDARICYKGYDEELMYFENWKNVVRMANGRFVLFVSDEDEVKIGALEHYLKLLNNCKNLSYVRAKTSRHYSSLFPKRQRYAQGRDAFLGGFLIQNYLSGFIVRKEYFLQINFESLEKFADNKFYLYYPHEWWCALLSLRGDYLEEVEELIIEGDSEYKNEVDKANSPDTLISYATYEERIKQFYGIVEFLHCMMKDDSVGAAVGIYKAIVKTAWLFCMAMDEDYDQEHFQVWIERFREVATDAIGEFQFEDIYRDRLLKEVSDCCERMSNEYINK